ncbi:Transcription elongation factor spt6 [Lambiella insularis]|nr:Transcription elongation factor spt6 [Lambiella insularis]
MVENSTAAFSTSYGSAALVTYQRETTAKPTVLRDGRMSRSIAKAVKLYEEAPISACAIESSAICDRENAFGMEGPDLPVPYTDFANDTEDFLPEACKASSRRLRHLRAGVELSEQHRVHPKDYELGRKMAADALELDEEDIQAEQLVRARLIDFDISEPESDYLDNTRVHPEDYELGRKMAADALELDDENIQAEQQENGDGVNPPFVRKPCTNIKESTTTGAAAVMDCTISRANQCSTEFAGKKVP